MTTAATVLTVTFALGYLARLLRMPPLIGFLAAGFALNAAGFVDLPLVDTIADLGVTLLLFGIGLKLDVRSLLQPEVWLTATVHLVASSVIGAGLLAFLGLFGVGLVAGLDLLTLLVLGFALAFSSTVFVVKLLEERGQSHAFYGRVAIGILIIQDLAAVAFLTATTGELPSPWAFVLLLLLPASWIFRRLWSRVGHGELQSLFGIVMALVPGYALFSAVGLKGDLGALIIGMLLASHPAASELSRSLFHLKELLLVGFFVSVGLAGGLPSPQHVMIALALLALLPVQAGLYAVLLWTRRLRHRTAWLAGFALMQYSEFGLIVVAVAASAGLMSEEWLLVLSLAVSLSFVIAALVNGFGLRLIERAAARAPRQHPAQLHPEDRPADVADAQVLVLGMGRVGRSSYDRLETGYDMRAVGVDNDGGRVRRLQQEGLRVVEGDACDVEFWRQLARAERVRIAILAMPRHGANISAVQALRESGFTGTIAAVARYEDEVEQAKIDGADAAFNVYAGAGLELADQVMRIEAGEPPTRPFPPVG